MAWDQLLSIYASAIDSVRAERSASPEACPECGTPLEADEEGSLLCPFEEHYAWPRDGRL